MTNVLMLILGLVAGGISVWMLARGKINDASRRAKAEAEAERAVLAERLQGKEQQIQSLTAEFQKLNEQLPLIQLQLKAEAQGRAVAEERNSQIPRLETVLQAKADESAALQKEVAALKAIEAKLNTTIEK